MVSRLPELRANAWEVTELLKGISNIVMVVGISAALARSVFAVVYPEWWDPPSEFSASISIPSWVYYDEQLPITETITHDDSKGIDPLYGAWVSFHFSADSAYFDYGSSSNSSYSYGGTNCIDHWDLYDDGDCYGSEKAHWRAGWSGAGTTSWARVVWKPLATTVHDDVWVNGQCRYKYFGSWTILKNVDKDVDILT